MGKLVLAILVGLWMFNLVRMVAGGLPGNVPVAVAAPDPVVQEATAEAAKSAFQRADTPLAEGVALAIRNARVSSGSNTAVSVALTLAEPAIVDLDLYDSNGHRMFTQTSRRLPAGHSNMQLQSIERLAPGQYWIRARVGDQIAMKPLAIHG
jgi:hypothetical protein